METLLDQADALILAADPEIGPERPDFEIPESIRHFTTPLSNHHHTAIIEIKENTNKGKGWYSKQSISVGTVLMVAKPIAMVLDSEYIGPDNNGNDDNDEHEHNDDDEKEAMEESETQEEEEEAQEGTVNELLVLDVLQAILLDPTLWTEQISMLYPRDAVDIAASPVWISKDDDIFAQFETIIRQIATTVPALRGTSQEISQRLPLIIRYNALSIETCPELLSHPGPQGHAPLSGVGLYHWPSFFNHDGRPNVSRYAVGDIMWFVTNQNVSAGQELCISYLEHDVLCESTQRRNAMLTLDFQEVLEEDDRHRIAIRENINAATAQKNDNDGTDIPLVDRDVQNELMQMNPFERLDAIDQLTQQASGDALPEGERPEADGGDNDQNMDAGGRAWFQCDLQNLRILKAITFEAMSFSDKALPIWNECVRFTETQMPPNDETSIVMRVQAALCALKLKQEALAKQHAAIALQRHILLFGGGVRRFRRRYRQEFRLNLRPKAGLVQGKSMEEYLWPYNNDHQEHL